jgi:hypothetical protein
LATQSPHRHIPPARTGIQLLAAAAAFSLIVGYADYTLAGSQRRAAQDIAARADTGKLWFTGHYGFQYYMELHGARPVDIGRSQPQPGDVVVIPSNNAWPIVPKDEIIGPTAQLRYHVFPWLVTVNHRMHAGFYADAAGPLPFTFGRAPEEIYGLITIVGPHRE